MLQRTADAWPLRPGGRSTSKSTETAAGTDWPHIEREFKLTKGSVMSSTKTHMGLELKHAADVMDERSPLSLRAYDGTSKWQTQMASGKKGGM